MKTHQKILDTIGNTPIVELVNLEKKYELKAHVFAKVEFFNPGGSVKDRVAKAMIEDAEAKGLINKDTVLVEPTSGTRIFAYSCQHSRFRCLQRASPRAFPGLRNALLPLRLLGVHDFGDVLSPDHFRRGVA